MPSLGTSSKLAGGNKTLQQHQGASGIIIIVSSTRWAGAPTCSIRWPRARTSDGSAEAASADATAYRFWLRFTFRCHRRHTFVGANMRPPRHMLPKAPWPARWVPPPGTRGIRDTARPVPHDSADVCMPASNFTAYGWRWFLARPVCTERTMSGLMGAVKTAGWAVCPVASPSAECTVTSGRDAAMVAGPEIGKRARRRAACRVEHRRDYKASGPFNPSSPLARARANTGTVYQAKRRLRCFTDGGLHLESSHQH